MTDKKNISRKRFMVWGAGLLATAGALSLWNPFKKRKPQMVKFLTQDGTLVEVDKKYLDSKGIKITNPELQEWIKK